MVAGLVPPEAVSPLKLGPVSVAPKDASPEYARLYGVGTDKSEVVIYAMFGVDADGSETPILRKGDWVL